MKNYFHKKRKEIDEESVPILNQSSNHSERSFKSLKIIRNFLGGIFIGICFYQLILTDLNFTGNSAIITEISLCLLLGLCCAISSQVRCITLLTLPSFCGNVGRSVMKTLIVAYLIAGPLTNISNNGKEIVRVFACTTSLTFNLTRTRFELLFKPFSEAILGLKADASEIKDTLRSIRDISSPIVHEVEDEGEIKELEEENDDLDEKLGDTLRSKQISNKYLSNSDKKGEQLTEAERYQKMYLRKIELRCEDLFTRAANKCRTIFQDCYNKCYETVTWIAAWLLCWPMKLNFVCNIPEALGGSKRCDPSKYIDPGFGDGYVYLKKSGKRFEENFRNVQMHYKIDKIKQFIDVKDGREAAKALLRTVHRKKLILDQIFLITKRLLAFIFLRVILRALNYHDNYLRNIQFDNFYITDYFRKIDNRRRISGKRNLLPLKKIERKKYLDVDSPKCLRHEKKAIIRQLFLILIEIFAASIFILLDRLFYELLDLIRRHGRIDYLQVGHHDFRLEIQGTGLIASLLRSVVKGFNIKKRIHIERNNEKCLPRPYQLSNYYLYKIYGMFVVIILLLWFQIYTQRFQRLICSLFYRKHEKKRILYIYNEMLKRRVGFSRHMKRKVRELIREHKLKEKYNICTILRIKYPKICNCLRIFPMARRNCLTCNEPEPFQSTNNFIQCTNDLCYFIYCAECWKDIENECIVCRLINDRSELISSDEYGEGTEEEADYY